jgi:hypothetical protein
VDFSRRILRADIRALRDTKTAFPFAERALETTDGAVNRKAVAIGQHRAVVLVRQPEIGESIDGAHISVIIPTS